VKVDRVPIDEGVCPFVDKRETSNKYHIGQSPKFVSGPTRVNKAETGTGRSIKKRL
jgi:hypothetical protein